LREQCTVKFSIYSIEFMDTASRILQIVVVIALIYLAYCCVVYLTPPEKFEVFREILPNEQVQQPLRPNMIVAPAGPSSPNSAPEPKMPAIRAQEPRAIDMSEENLQEADEVDQLRYPERSFGPGKVPQNVLIAQAAGLANKATALTAQANQIFTPERVTNGGNFFGEVAAMEGENANYTAF